MRIINEHVGNVYLRMVRDEVRFTIILIESVGCYIYCV